MMFLRLQKKTVPAGIILPEQKGSAYQKEAVELTRILKDRAVYEETDETEADFSCITTMKKAVAWLCGR